MPRVARVVIAEVAHHVTQRGNGRQFILATDTERQVYLDLLRQAVRLHELSLAGDKAACKKIPALVPNAECAEVKSGVCRTGGFSLSHPAACALIREKAALALKHLSDCKPCRTSVPVELKIEYTTRGTPAKPRPNFERLDDRTWMTRGKDFMEVYGRI